MKTMLYKAIVVLLLVPVAMSANHNKWKGKYTKEKTIKKEFDVSANATLEVDNSYGNISITSWNQNRVVIEVKIKTNGNNEEKVQKKLDQIDVDFEASNSMVSAHTTFDKNKGKSWWNSWSKNNNVRMQVNYTIKVPVSNNIDISNDYGGISLDKIDGDAKINCDYGSLDIGELNGDYSYLNFDYTQNSEIEYMKGGKINADYSGFTLGKVGDLILNADYTSSTINEANNIRYNCDYNSLKIGKANNIEGNSSYLAMRLGTISGNVEASLDYGSLKIERLTASPKNLRIRGDYCGIKIGYDSSLSFDFEISLEYAGLKSDGFQFNKKRVESSEKYYQGYHGKEGSGNNFYINSEYGGVTFIRQ